MICPSCNTPNRDDAKFCKKCGQSFRTEAEATPSRRGVINHARTEGPLWPPATPAVQESADTADTENAVDDPSLAPTQIISPQQMMAFHASRWQKDLEREDPSSKATPAQDQAAVGDGPGVINHAPTPSPTPTPVQDEQLPDMPTVLMQPSSTSEPVGAGLAP